MVAGAVVFLIGLAGAKCVPVVAWALQAPPVSQQSQAFDDFTRRVQQYVKLHNAVQSSLPRLKTTQQRKTIVERQRALEPRKSGRRAQTPCKATSLVRKSASSSAM